MTDNRSANEAHFYKPGVKRGNTPAGCVQNNPYCECRDGLYCQRNLRPREKTKKRGGND